MTELEQIEQKFDFKYPEIYRQLHHDRMLDWFRGWNEPWTKERNWGNVIYPTLLDNPPLLLYANDFEIIETNRIIEEIEAFKDPEDYRKTKSEFQFVPIAQTGAGDLYVFQFDKTEGENVPITLVYHDDETAVILAKNLQDFIFRELLEAVVEIGQYSGIAKGDFKMNRTNILKSHKPYLTQTQFELLEEIYNRELFDYTYTIYSHRNPEGKEYSAKGLVSKDELTKILQQEIGFDKLDQEFVYMG